ncbi:MULTISPECIES: hypothetical protein [Thermomonosporaceae]|uniref:hypothetical protein n=1 Tax=Thermomonosporaceae TaxID=2012 RepID=UPI00255AA2D6|nr:MULTISPECIES: hypothetical protein [Thermomonosporaceae]MDL4771502.1 hypothetical protein [Actinomadura xylanilytica]
MTGPKPGDGEDRDRRDNSDDMGDDDQAEEVALTEEYVEDPPDDLVIDDPDAGEIGISEYERRRSRKGSGPWPEPNDPAEADAVKPTDWP